MIGTTAFDVNVLCVFIIRCTSTSCLYVSRETFAIRVTLICQLIKKKNTKSTLSNSVGSILENGSSRQWFTLFYSYKIIIHLYDGLGILYFIV